MTQFGSGQPPAAMRRQGSPLGPSVTNTRLGVQATPQVVGLATLPPVAPGGTLADGAINALNALGNFANAASNTIDRQTAKIERNNREVRMLDIGRATRESATRLVEIQADIESGKIALPDGVEATPENVTAFATKYIDSELAHDGISEDYKAEFRTLIPRMASSMQRKLAEQRAEARDLLSQQLADGAVGSGSAEEMMAFRDSAIKNPLIKMSPLEADQKVLLPALQAAAQTGNVGAFEAASKALGGRFAAEQQVLRERLQSNVESRDRERRSGIANEYAAAWAREQPLDVMKAKFERDIAPGGRLSGPADGLLANSIREDIAGRERDLAKTALKLSVERAKATNLADWQQQIDAMGQQGVLTVIPDSGFETTLPDGTKQSLSRNDAIELATTTAFDRIAALYPNQPGTVLVKQAEWAARNGVKPSTWTRVLDAGATQATEASLSGDGKTEPRIPPVTETGYSLYRTLKANQPALLEQLVTSSRTRDLYETAIVLQEDQSIGTTGAGAEQKALANAARIVSDPAKSEIGSIKRTTLESKVNGLMSSGSLWWGQTANNKAEIGADIARRAEIFTRAGLDPDKAVARAAEQVGHARVIVNNWAIPSTDINNLPGTIREKIDDIAKTYIGEWVAAHKDAGYSAADLTFAPNRNNGFWTIVDGTTGLVVDPTVLYTPADIERDQKRREAAAKAAADAKIIADNAANRKPVTLPQPAPASKMPGRGGRNILE